MDVARLNFSHADHATHENSFNMIREINQKHQRTIAILQDLQGPKIRVGVLASPLEVEPGMVVTLRADLDTHEAGSPVLPVIYPTIAQDVEVGQPILIDDGKVECEVIETDGVHTVKIKVHSGREIKSRKGVNLPQTNISEPTITEKDLRDLEFTYKFQPDWLALSFVRTAEDITRLRALLDEKSCRSRIVAKIEKPEALENIDEIIQATDAIMVARGDLGVEIPMEQVPAWQKRIVRKCNQQGKPVIVATQMMESMIDNPRPTRAEASDVGNAVVDGADAVMLSGETSVGKYPVRVVESMGSIVVNIEQEDESIYYRNMEYTPDNTEAMSVAVAKTACRLAKETEATAIMGMTRSGYTAFQISRCRPDAMVFAFTPNKEVLTMLNLVWGVRAFFYDQFVSIDETIQDLHEIIKDKDLVSAGDILINTGSMPLEAHGLTNMIKISRMKEKGQK